MDKYDWWWFSNGRSYWWLSSYWFESKNDMNAAWSLKYREVMKNRGKYSYWYHKIVCRHSTFSSLLEIYSEHKLKWSHVLELDSWKFDVRDHWTWTWKSGVFCSEVTPSYPSTGPSYPAKSSKLQRHRASWASFCSPFFKLVTLIYMVEYLEDASFSLS